MIIGLIRTRVNRAKNRGGREILSLNRQQMAKFFDISLVVVSAANMVSSAPVRSKQFDLAISATCSYMAQDKTVLETSG